jgi:caffeoyl-CoA O-methyltransferase
MFHEIPTATLEQMKYLEDLDMTQRNGMIDLNYVGKLCQIPPETGRFISLIAAGSPRQGQWLELGTSAGYSTLWLSLACKQLNKKITTFEQDNQKITLAKKIFSSAGLEDTIELVTGNLLDHLAFYKNIAFCFLDTSNEIYSYCYEIIIPNLRPGGVMLADNVISHQADLVGFVDRALSDTRVNSVVVPIGKGLLMSRKQER